MTFKGSLLCSMYTEISNLRVQTHDFHHKNYKDFLKRNYFHIGYVIECNFKIKS